MAQIKYSIHTLVDITKTDVLSSKEDNLKERNQQRNWETVTQVLNLRTQISDVSTPIALLQDAHLLGMGSEYKGKKRIWTFSFTVDSDSISKDSSDPFKLLRYDFEMVPVITGLDETAPLNPPMFVPDGKLKNVHFSFLRND